jgi:hypothetical protein
MPMCHIWSLQMLVYLLKLEQLLTDPDNLPLLPETTHISPQTLYRFRIPLQDAIERIPSMCGTAVAG